VSTVHVRSTVSVGGDRHPPVILVHGAANSGMVWRFWQGELAGRGCSSHALDLRGHGESTPVDLSNTRRGDYAADVVMVARELRRPAVLLGWSMGGLVAMMAAASCGALACIGLAPSTPVRLSDPSVSRSPAFHARSWWSRAPATPSGRARATRVFTSRGHTSRSTAPLTGDWS
jgi:pimeloyl-ACP methyl ester carboxylesterase